MTYFFIWYNSVLNLKYVTNPIKCQENKLQFPYTEELPKMQSAEIVKTEYQNITLCHIDRAPSKFFWSIIMKHPVYAGGWLKNQTIDEATHPLLTVRPLESISTVHWPVTAFSSKEFLHPISVILISFSCHIYLRDQCSIHTLFYYFVELNWN